MPEFKREPRYIVLKISDVKNALTPEQQGQLSSLIYAVSWYRQAAGKKPLESVVVENDWPIYNAVWKMVEDIA